VHGAEPEDAEGGTVGYVPLLLVVVPDWRAEFGDDFAAR
jgi:hypothetical protein